MVITCTTCGTKHVISVPVSMIWIKCPVGDEQAKKSHTHDYCVLCPAKGFPTPEMGKLMQGAMDAEEIFSLDELEAYAKEHPTK